MTKEEKDNYQVHFSKTLLEIGDIIDPIRQGVVLFRKLSEMIESIYQSGYASGRIDGFAEGHKEARRQLERKFGKLN